MCEEKKDYNLLRPFDLEAAKRGDEVVDAADMSESKRVAFVGVKGEVVIDWDSVGVCTYTPEKYRQLRMKPLCWLEGKPVYKGDVLYYKENGHSIKVKGYNPRIPDNTGLEGTILTQVGYSGRVGSLTWAQISAWTWTKPKIKKEGWINIVDEGDSVYIKRIGNFIYETEKLAKCGWSSPVPTKQVRIEWEE